MVLRASRSTAPKSLSTPSRRRLSDLLLDQLQTSGHSRGLKPPLRRTVRGACRDRQYSHLDDHQHHRRWHSGDLDQGRHGDRCHRPESTGRRSEPKVRRGESQRIRSVYSPPDQSPARRSSSTPSRRRLSDLLLRQPQSSGHSRGLKPLLCQGNRPLACRQTG